MSEIRAVTNLFSDIFATVVVSKWMGELGDKRLRAVLDGGHEDAAPEQLSVGAARGSQRLTNARGNARPARTRQPTRPRSLSV